MLSIILPCYNPTNDWIEKVTQSMAKLNLALAKEEIQLIVVDDGNKSRAVFENIDSLKSSCQHFEFVSYSENQGKGYAIRQGVQRASGDIIIYTDIDFPYKEESLLEVYNALKNETFDVVVGIKDKNYYKNVPFIRRFISKTLRFIIGIILRIPITDTQCGLKGFKNHIKPKFLSTQISRYLFDLEFIHICFRSQPKIQLKAMPVVLKDGIIFRKMNIGILRQELYNFLIILVKKSK